MDLKLLITCLLYYAVFGIPACSLFWVGGCCSVNKGHEERRDSFVKTALFVLRVSGKTHAINKLYENSRPWRELNVFLFSPLKSLPDFSIREQERQLNMLYTIFSVLCHSRLVCLTVQIYAFFCICCFFCGKMCDDWLSGRRLGGCGVGEWWSRVPLWDE